MPVVARLKRRATIGSKVRLELGVCGAPLRNGVEYSAAFSLQLSAPLDTIVFNRCSGLNLCLQKHRVEER